MRCRSVSLSCKGKINHLIRLPEIFKQVDQNGPAANLASFDECDIQNTDALKSWTDCLRRFYVFFCAPLDLDYSMLRAFPAAYQVIEPGRLGPSVQGDPRVAVLGENGRGDLYAQGEEESLRWYRYLFLGRGKPSTHVRVLSSQRSEILAEGAPEELRELLTYINSCLDSAL